MFDMRDVVAVNPASRPGLIRVFLASDNPSFDMGDPLTWFFDPPAVHREVPKHAFGNHYLPGDRFKPIA